MKTKITIILITLGLVISLGATKISKKSSANGKHQSESSSTYAIEPAGGFISEDH